MATFDVMPNFDFLSDKQFRETLEADHAELEACVKAGAWKAAQVTAGSVVEALLIDYIQAHPDPNRRTRRPVLEMDLGEAIEVCKAEGVITKNTADLCSVIRAYRNLIHPGRMVRTNEPAPSEGTATIARQLVDIIISELVRELQKRVGLTAEQVLSKVLRDRRSVKVLSHLLKKFDENQRLRLLIEILPAAYFQYQGSTVRDELEKAVSVADTYRAVFEGAQAETKQAVMREFVRIIREDDGDKVEKATLALFRAKDIEHLAEEDKPLVMDHLRHAMPRIHESIETVRPLKGIHKFVGEKSLAVWLDPLLRGLANCQNDAPLKPVLEDIITDFTWLPDSKVREAAEKRMKEIQESYRKAGQHHKAKMLEAVVDVPF